jgi:hypothetical protein
VWGEVVEGVDAEKFDLRVHGHQLLPVSWGCTGFAVTCEGAGSDELVTVKGRSLGLQRLDDLKDGILDVVFEAGMLFSFVLYIQFVIVLGCGYGSDHR